MQQYAKIFERPEIPEMWISGRFKSPMKTLQPIIYEPKEPFNPNI